MSLFRNASRLVGSGRAASCLVATGRQMIVSNARLTPTAPTLLRFTPVRVALRPNSSWVPQWSARPAVLPVASVPLATACFALRSLVPIAQCSPAAEQPAITRNVATLSQTMDHLKEEKVLRRLFRIFSRALRHILLFTPVLCAFPFAYLLNRVGFIWNGWWSWFLWTIQVSGPTFIKFGQWASSRRDLFSVEVCNRCAQLHASVMHHTVAETEATLDESFGVGWRDIMVLEPIPVGSGCVAQVYRAHLKHPSGKGPSDVAVKVIHPQVQKQVIDDVDLLRFVAKAIELIPMLRWVSARDGVEEFSRSMTEQLDLRNEGYNMLRFQENFKDVSDVIVPRVIPELTSENVLVETYEEGQPMHVMFDGDEKLRRRLARRGLELFFKMMFKDNFIHGDLHPGNMRVTGVDEHGQPTGEPVKILLLDGGIITEMTRRDRANFIDLFGAIVHKDGRECGRLMLSRARLHDCDDPEGFISSVDKLVRTACDITDAGFRDLNSGMRLNKVQVGELLQRVLTLMCQYRVKIESNFTNVLIGIMVAEGVGRALDPEVDLMVLAGPILLKEKAKMALLGQMH